MSFSEGLRENGNENIVRKSEPPCGGGHEWGRRQSRLSGRGFARHSSHVAAGRGESIRDYLRHIRRGYQRNKSCEQCGSFRRRRRATRQGLGKPAYPRRLPNRSTRYRKQCVSVPCCAPSQRQTPIGAALRAGLRTVEFPTRPHDRLPSYPTRHSSGALERPERYRVELRVGRLGHLLSGQWFAAVVATRPPYRAPRGYCSLAHPRLVCASSRVSCRADRSRTLWRRIDAPVGARQCSAASRSAPSVGHRRWLDLPRRTGRRGYRSQPFACTDRRPHAERDLCRYVGYGPRATTTCEPDSGQCARGHWVALESRTESNRYFSYPAQRANRCDRRFSCAGIAPCDAISRTPIRRTGSEWC